MKFRPSLEKTSIISLALTALTVLLYFMDPAFLRFMEYKSLDLKFQARGILQPGSETVIVAVDEKSLDQVGRWPWSRDIQARLVRSLTEYGVRVIGLDFVFSEPETNPGLARIRELQTRLHSREGTDPEILRWIRQVKAEADTDQRFANALRRSGKTLLGYFFHFSEKGLEHLKKAGKERSFENIRATHYNAVRFAGGSSRTPPFQKVYAVESSISRLTRAASGGGFFSLFTDDDGAIRRIPLIVNYRDSFFPPLSLEALKLYLGKQVSFSVTEYGVERVEIGAISIPTDGEGKLLINYYGPQNTFPVYSAADILSHRVAVDSLKGKIVLVGATAIGIYDLRNTPFQKNYPGVEVNATVVDNILHQRFLAHPDWVVFIDLSAVGICGLLVALLTTRLSVLRSVGFIASLGLIFLSWNYFLFRQGIQSSLIYPLLNLILVYAGVSLYKLFTEGREKRFIKGAFSHYLSPEVIGQLVANPDLLKLGGERKVLTAFFSDVAGFSTISERLSPEELVELLNRYLTEMTDIIMKFHGTVDKFEGDAIIAFYGAPLPFEDHATRACLAGLEMQERLGQLRDQWQREGRPELFVRMGINTGPMVVGNMGSASRMDYTMMGDSVNLASRLEGANKPYGTHIMISENTFQQARDAVEARKLDMIQVVGKAEPVTVYELLARKGELGPAMQKKIDLFHTGLSSYLEQQWDTAIRYFESVLRIGEDAPSLVYIQRCKMFQSRPPERGWDGVFHLTEK